eukprot:961053-Prymnesium_polylepis.1
MPGDGTFKLLLSRPGDLRGTVLTGRGSCAMAEEGDRFNTPGAPWPPGLRALRSYLKIHFRVYIVSGRLNLEDFRSR